MDPIREIEAFIEAQKRDGGPYRSERQLSLAFGSQSTIQNWRYGVRRPLLESAEALADVMGAAGWWRDTEHREDFINRLLRLQRRSDLEAATTPQT